MNTPAWIADYHADGTTLAGNWDANGNPIPDSYIVLTVPPSPGFLWGLLVGGAGRSYATISNYYPQISCHAWQVVFTGTYNSPDFDASLALYGDAATQITVTFYNINFVQIMQFMLNGDGASAGLENVLNIGSNTFTGYMAIYVNNCGTTKSDLVLNGAALSTISLVTTAWTFYNKSSEVINFKADTTVMSDVLTLSEETRLIRSLAVVTDVESVNTLNGSVTQAYCFGSVAPTLTWTDYLFKSPTSRQSALAKGFDLFFVAQEGQYNWANRWVANPFMDPNCTPSVALISANYAQQSVQLQFKCWYWAEFCSMNVAIPTLFVMDHSQEWFTLISAFMECFRYSANFDHRKVLAGISSMASWLVGGTSEAVALRKAIYSVGKLAAGAALAVV